MISVSDILKILDSVPIWKSLVALPKRIAELESRVKALEVGKAAQTGPNPRECPKCGAVMTMNDEVKHPDFGFAGLKIHRFSCENCGAKAERNWSPKKGYE